MGLMGYKLTKIRVVFDLCSIKINIALLAALYYVSHRKAVYLNLNFAHQVQKI